MAVVYALGSNGSGQLGIGHTEDVSVPKPVLWPGEPPESVTVAAAGGNHTLLLSGDGQLYCSGESSSGACGIVRSPENGTRFTKVAVRQEGAAEGKMSVRLAAATWEASIFTALDDQGHNNRVYSCGMGQKGELGQGPLIIRDPWASQLKNFPPAGIEIVDLSACMSHVVAVLSNGEVYGWGNGRKGQLGAPEGVIFEPRRIENVGFPVTRAVCGKDFTCFIGNKEQGQLVVFGQDKWGVKTDAPATVPGWKDIGAGWGNIFILKEDGKILVWGRNDYSQSSAPTSQNISKIAIGSEHALALLESGDVMAWGWGEHGNCGPPSKADNNASGRRNVIASSKYLPPQTSIAAIGAGCATSWVIIKTADEKANGNGT